MKRFIIVVSFLSVLAGLSGFFPLSFTGSCNPTPVTLADGELIHVFGTYHDEVNYLLEAKRLNSYHQNYKPTENRLYMCWDDENWEYRSGVAYDYDDAGQLVAMTEILESGTQEGMLREYLYNSNHEGRIDRINLEWNEDNEIVQYYDYLYDDLFGEPDTVNITYIPYDDSVFATSMLNTFLYNLDEEVVGWWGHCYGVGNDIFSSGEYSWEDGRLFYYRYETPANIDREHVIMRGQLVWEDDQLCTIEHLGETGDDIYGTTDYIYAMDGRLQEIELNYDEAVDPLAVYTYEYDEHGRMTSETNYSYNADGTLNHKWRYDWTYETWVGVNDEDTPPLSAGLRAWPNPFNPQTTIGFSLPQAGEVDLTVYNIRGERVDTLTSGMLSAGEHRITWDAQGRASGVYFARIQGAGVSETTKLLLLQ